jgi:hypothetical protein
LRATQCGAGQAEAIGCGTSGAGATDPLLQTVQVEDALQEATEDSSGYDEEMQHACKAARRAAPSRAASSRSVTTAETLSRLLAAAPSLIDVLLQEDSIRCLTLVVRDVINLSLAAGGGVCLEPVWDALAVRIRRVGWSCVNCVQSSPGLS